MILCLGRFLSEYLGKLRLGFKREIGDSQIFRERKEECRFKIEEGQNYNMVHGINRRRYWLGPTPICSSTFPVSLPSNTGASLAQNRCQPFLQLFSDLYTIHFFLIQNFPKYLISYPFLVMDLLVSCN